MYKIAASTVLGTMPIIIMLILSHTKNPNVFEYYIISLAVFGIISGMISNAKKSSIGWMLSTIITLIIFQNFALSNQSKTAIEAIFTNLEG
jgi:hypothetical protein